MNCPNKWVWFLNLAILVHSALSQAITDFRAGQAVIHIVELRHDSVLVMETVSGEHPRQRWLEFFRNRPNDADDSLLYVRMGRGQVIENLFIESMNFERIESAETARGKWTLKYAFRMSNCIVYNTAPLRRQPNEKIERQFSKPLTIDNCIFRNGLDWSGVVFVDSVRIENSHVSGIDFSGSTFWKPVLINRVSASNQLNFSKILFNRSRIDLSVRSFFSLTESYISDIDMSDAIFNVPAFFNRTFFGSRLSFYHTQFLKGSDLSEANFANSMNLNGATFKKFTRLRNIDFHENDVDRARALIPGLSLLENADLADSVSPDENIVKYGLNLVTLKQVWFDLSAFNVNEAERLLSSLIQNVNANANAPEELRNDALARLKYQVIQLQRINPETSALDKAIYGILEIIVRNGYEGGARFFLTSLIVIVFFSILYQSRYMADVTVMVKGEHVKTETKEMKSGLFAKVSGHFLARLLEFFQAMWFSVYIFLSPKFPSEIFQRSSVFQLIATIEWVFGVCMMIVYFVFIASNYAFIRSLLGI